MKLLTVVNKIESQSIRLKINKTITLVFWKQDNQFKTLNSYHFFYSTSYALASNEYTFINNFNFIYQHVFIIFTMFLFYSKLAALIKP